MNRHYIVLRSTLESEVFLKCNLKFLIHLCTFYILLGNTSHHAQDWNFSNKNLSLSVEQLLYCTKMVGLRVTEANVAKLGWFFFHSKTYNITIYQWCVQ